MAVRTQRRRARLSRAGVPQPSLLPTRPRHHRRDQRIKLAAIRRVSVEPSQSEGRSVLGEPLRMGNIPEWLAALSSLVFVAALTMLAVGTMRSLDEVPSIEVGGATLVFPAIGCAVAIGIHYGRRERLVWAWGWLRRLFHGRAGHGRTRDGCDQPVPGPPGDMPWLGAGALAVGLMLVLSPAIGQRAWATGMWFEQFFLWSPVSEMLLWFVMTFLTLVVPVATTGVVWRCAIFMRASSERGNSSMLIAVAMGVVLGIAGTKSIANTGAPHADAIYAAAMPCFLLALGSVWRGSRVSDTDPSDRPGVSHSEVSVPTDR